MADTKEIQTTLGKCFKNLYSTKLGKLNAIHEFLDSAKPPKWDQTVINNIDRLLIGKEIEIAIRNLPVKK